MPSKNRTKTYVENVSSTSPTAVRPAFRLNLILPFLPLFIFAFSLIIYILTLSRSVYFGDSGELIAAAKTLGIAHPPGYPLYTMLAHLFTYLPFGNLPFRVNLFSAVTSSLTIVVVYFICLKLTANRLASASASLFLAFSYLFWLYSLVAEVFSLNTFFLALLILISLYIFENPTNTKLYYLLSFIFGLSLTNHHTILLITPALLFLIVSTNPKLLLNIKFIVLNTLFIILGLLPYLYLPIRALQNPALNWGDPDTLSKFLDVVLRRDYGTFSLSASVGANPFKLEPLFFYFSSFFWQFLGIGILLAVIGLVSLAKANKKLLITTLLAYLFTGPAFFLLTKTVPDVPPIKGALERFMLASFVIFTPLIALGISKGIQEAAKFPGKLPHLVILLPILPLILNFGQVNQSKNFLYEEMGEQMLATLPPNSLFISFGDKGTMISRYLQIGAGVRPDIKVANFNFIPDLWYQENLKQRHPDFVFPFEKFQPNKLSYTAAGEIICKQVVPNVVTFIEDTSQSFSPIVNHNCSYHPTGTLIRLDLPQNQPTKEELEAMDQNFWQSLQQKLKEDRPVDNRTKTVLYGYSQAKTFLGIMLATYSGDETALKAYIEAFEISQDNAQAAHLAAQKFAAKKELQEAFEWEKKAIAAQSTFAQPYKSLGFLSLEAKQDKKMALYYFKKYLRYTEDSKDKEQIKKLVNQLENQLN